MIIESFEVECFVGDEPRLRAEDRLRLLPAVGLRRTRSGSRTDEERARLDAPQRLRGRPHDAARRATSRGAAAARPDRCC